MADDIDTARKLIVDQVGVKLVHELKAELEKEDKKVRGDTIESIQWKGEDKSVISYAGDYI